MIITAHKGEDNEKMVKIIGTCPYVTAVGGNVPEDFVLYAKDGNDKMYSVMVVSDYEKAESIKLRLGEKL